MSDESPEQQTEAEAMDREPQLRLAAARYVCAVADEWQVLRQIEVLVATNEGVLKAEAARGIVYDRRGITAVALAEDLADAQQRTLAARNDYDALRSPR